MSLTKIRCVHIIIVSVLSVLFVTQSKPTFGRQQVEEFEHIFTQMSPDERIGQVFLVAFEGDVENFRIQELIRDLKIGSLIVSEGNGKFSNSAAEEPASVQVAHLTNSLQTFAWETNRKEISNGEFYFLPLLLAVDHEGNGPPLTSLRSGMTNIPSQLSVGATWRTQNAEIVGRIIGEELSAIGINMLLGPVVDVVDEPAQTWKGNMGLRVFGGNPQWVGKFGRAYVNGVRKGSNGRIVTVAKHFPGHGDSDRTPDNEVAYLKHTLEELRNLDLIPFVMMTKKSEEDDFLSVDATMSVWRQL